MKKIKETTSNPDPGEHRGKIGNEHFPVDILLDHLLVRLPARSVVSFMCVCKEWYNSIKNPSFMNFYFQNSHLYADTCLIYGRENSLGLVSCKTFDVVSSYHFPSEKFSDPLVQIVGSANGLLCLFSFDQTDEPIYLMNPSIGKYKVINSSSIAHRTIGIDTRVILGFGHHQKSGDYKIVRFLERKRDGDKLFVESDVEIYSLSMNAWKEIKLDEFPWIIRDEASSVMYNERLHWIAHNWELERVILSFDVGNDVLEEVKLPDYGVTESDNMTESIVVLMECLCLFVNVLPMGFAGESTRCYLWIMNDYGVAESWTKLYDIEFQEKVRRCISYTGHDQIILEDIRQNILLYDVDTRDFNYLNTPEKQFLVKFAPYKESLFLLDQKNDTLEIESSSKEHTREVICSSVVEEDSDDLELFSEEYSNDEPSDENSFEISDEELSESFDEDSSDRGKNCPPQEGEKHDCNLRAKSLNLLNEISEKEGQLTEEPSSKSVNTLVHEEGSSDCTPKTENDTS